MNNLEKLQEAIYNALPRLKDDVAGQRYERHGDVFTCLFIDDSVKSEPFFYLYNTKITTWYLTEIQTRFNVLGQEIALNDVMEWLIISKHIVYFDNYENEFVIIVIKGATEYTLKWDLSKPHLKDQSTELINYLNELI